jgi:hypothetical protein
VLVTHRRYQMATLSKDRWKDIEKLTKIMRNALHKNTIVQP